MTKRKQINFKNGYNKYRLFEIEGKVKDDQNILHVSLTILYKRLICPALIFVRL